MRKKISSWFLLIGLVFVLAGCGAGGGGSADNPAAGGADTTPPTVSSVSPTDGATSVAINSTIIVTFSESVDGSTVDTNTFIVKDSSNNIVTGSVASGSPTATFTPSLNLTADTTYTVIITTGIEDSAGNAMTAEYTWTFTTGSGADTTGPSITGHTPSTDATGVAVNSTISVIFSESIDPSTIDTTTFTLEDSSNNNITGTVSYDDASKTATFTPSSALSPGTTYYVNITQDVEDMAGNMLVALEWMFTTVSAGTAPSAPTGVTATPGDNQVAIAWAAATGATSYKVYRATSSGALSAKTAVTTGVATTGYTDSTAVNGTVYYYQVTALNSYGESSGSSEVSATPTSGGGTFTTTPMVKAGDLHTAALKSDGTVWAWGSNTYGQLGTTIISYRETPAQVSGIASVTAIAAGNYHTVALKSDGTVWAWGGNYFGQLGDGTTTNSSTPVQVSGISDVTAIAAGAYHTVALKSDGTVWAWGDNGYGRLGDGTTTDRNTPVQVSGITGVSAIAAGYDQTIALKSDGTVWAWGFNFYGQLGDGTTTTRKTPIQVSGLTGMTAIAADSKYTVALKNDGTVWAWGYNLYGQLGDGTATNRKTPVQVSDLTGVSAIDAGDVHTVALKSDGTVWAWGDNTYGQLGGGTTTASKTPIQVSGLTGVSAIDAGGDYTFALKSDGTVWAWGYNGSGQLGDGTTTNRSTPVQVLGSGGTGYLNLQ